MKISVLDFGYVEFIEMWGSDERIIESARVSTNKGFQGWGPIQENTGTGSTTREGDEKLLKYLYKNKHMTPFEMGGATFEIQAPIFVFREWHRHRTQSYNEMSARYTPLPDMNYVPTMERLLMTDGKNKQAQSTGNILDESTAQFYQSKFIEVYAALEEYYRGALKAGVPKELARIILPVGRYSKMRGSANLRNWMHFLTLRLDPHAQWEIRQFADAVCKILSATFPRTMELFLEENNNAKI